MTRTEEFQQMKQLKQEGLSNREIRKQLELSEGTVRKRLKAGFASGKLGRFRAVFTPDQEKEIVSHAKKLDQVSLTESVCLLLLCIHTLN